MPVFSLLLLKSKFLEIIIPPFFLMSLLPIVLKSNSLESSFMSVFLNILYLYKSCRGKKFPTFKIIQGASNHHHVLLSNHSLFSNNTTSSCFLRLPRMVLHFSTRYAHSLTSFKSWLKWHLLRDAPLTTLHLIPHHSILLILVYIFLALTWHYIYSYLLFFCSH